MFLEINNSRFPIDETQDLNLIPIEKRQFFTHLDNKKYLVEILETNEDGKLLKVKLNDKIFDLALINDFDILVEKLGFNTHDDANILEIMAPMPGLVLEIMVKEEQEIVKGDPLLVLEAMKMENIIKSPRDGKIKNVFVSAKNPVDKNQILIEFE